MRFLHLDESSRESIAAWAAMGVLAAGSSAIGSALVPGRFAWLGALGPVIPFLWCTLVSPLVVVLAARIRSRPLVSRVCIHLAAFLALSLVSAATLSILCRCPLTGPFAGRNGSLGLMLNLMIYGGVASTLWITDELAKASEQERRKIELDAGVELQRVRLVQSRIPASFLTGAFDALERLISISPIRADLLLLRFAGFLRRMLAALSAAVWPIEKELELVSDYVAVSALEWGDEPEVQLAIDEPARRQRVSAGAFQAALFPASTVFAAGCSDSWRISAARIGDEIALTISDAHSGGAVLHERTAIVTEMAEPILLQRLPEGAGHSTSVRSPWLLGIAAVLAAAAVAIAAQMIERYAGLSPAYIPYAALRAVLWFVPLLIAWTLLRATRPRWLFSVATVFLASLIGEMSFFTILHSAGVRHIPSPFTPAMLSMVLTSLVMPLIVTLPLLLVLEGIRMSRTRLEREAVRIQSEGELAAAQMHLLRNQLHPHFLFNALNSLAALVKNDRPSSLRMLNRLRDFYRSAEATAGQPIITLAEEIRLVQQYLEIEKVRFGSRLTVEILADASIADARVPALFLQPIAENAIHHGVSRITGPAWVRLSATSRDGRFRITIANSGRHGSRSQAGAGLGLLNTRERLARMFGDDFALGWRELDDASVIVTVVLPRLAGLPA